MLLRYAAVGDTRLCAQPPPTARQSRGKAGQPVENPFPNNPDVPSFLGSAPLLTAVHFIDTIAPTLQALPLLVPRCHRYNVLMVRPQRPSQGLSWPCEPQFSYVQGIGQVRRDVDYLSAGDGFLTDTP